MTDTTTEKVATFLGNLQSRRPQLKEVVIEGLGTVWLARMTGTDNMEIAEIKHGITKQGITAIPTTVLGAIMAVVLFRNGDGSKMFPDAKAGFQELIQSDSEDLSKIHDVIMEETGINAKARQLLEEAEKKSLSGQKSDSGTS